MKLQPIIDRLVSQVNSFGDRVAGAAEFERFKLRNELVIPPSAFVMLSDDSATHVSIHQGPQPFVTTQFVVVVAVSNKIDAGGRTALDEVEDLYQELLTDLVGFSPDVTRSRIRYESGELISQDEYFLWWGFIFSTIQFGDHVFSVEMTAQLLSTEGTTPTTVLNNFTTKLEGTPPGGLVWTIVQQVYTFGEWPSALDLPVNEVVYSATLQPAGVPEEGLSNVDNRVFVLRLQFEYRGATGPETNDRTDGKTVAALVQELQVLDYLEVAGVRQVLEPFRLTFPGDVSRKVGEV